MMMLCVWQDASMPDRVWQVSLGMAGFKHAK